MKSLPGLLLFACLMYTSGALPVSAAPDPKPGGLPSASSDKLPRWRGFNLLEKFSKDWSSKPFIEEDFKLISSLGFNFVRLPLDYRTWIKDDDWMKFNEATLKEIDEAVSYGRKYNIHVCINFHRAPGYCVNPPKEPLDLWTDPEAQRVCALHWATFAGRYKGIPNEQLSFDLLNEPAISDEAPYLRVVKTLVDAIRKEDPNRLIIADGLSYGTKPCFELVPLKIAQSTRGYSPMEISHYRAPWVDTKRAMPAPSWPVCRISPYLYGPGKKDITSPLIIDGSFPAGTGIRLKVGTVSHSSKLTISADGKVIFEKSFTCGPGTGEWEKAVYVPEWKNYQNTYNKDYTAILPAKAKAVEIANTDGDWLSFSELGITLPANQPASGELVLMPADHEWGRKHKPLRFDPSDKFNVFKTPDMSDRQWLWQTNIEPWLKLEATSTGIMVGEWGAFNRTPHDVTLRWMRDCLENWKKAGWGWALWNFRGPFGILDSERKDVIYEDFNGHKLDRKMLELLKQY